MENFVGSRLTAKDETTEVEDGSKEHVSHRRNCETTVMSNGFSFHRTTANIGICYYISYIVTFYVTIAVITSTTCVCCV